MLTGTVGVACCHTIMIAVALVVWVSRRIRVENEQPVPSLLSKSNTAILPSSAAALVTVHVAGPAVNVATARSAVTSNACGPDIEMPMLVEPSAGDVTSRWLAGDGNTYIRIRGRPPSAGVDMLALENPEKSCAWPLIESLPTPPRPKLSVCALPAASVKPES